MMKSKLRWRCRRGTRELDVLLEGLLDRCFDGLGRHGQAAFVKLVEQQDPTITDWIWGRAPAPDGEIGELIEMIRKEAGLVPE